MENKIPPPKRRVAVLTSHPIEQQGPFFKVLAAEPDVDLQVFFAWDFGVHRPTLDPDFGIPIQWDIPLLDGYRHRFLRNLSPRPTSARFWGEINPGIVAAIWKGRYDALVMYGWSSVTAWLAFLAALASGTPFFIRGDNPLRRELFKPRWLRSLKKAILGPFFRLAGGFLYVGEENKKFAEYYGVPGRKLFRMPHSVNNPAFKAAAAERVPRKSDLKRQLGADPALPLILFVGKLMDKKRPFDLLYAFADLCRPATLVFVGEGALRPAMERFVRDRKIANVRFAGFKNQTEVPDCYAAADIFVLPSGSETWGYVVNEAMCFGLPIIASNQVGSAPDLVREEDNGFVFPCGDIEQLREALRNLIDHPALRERFGHRSQAIVEEYNYDASIAGLRSALHSIEPGIGNLEESQSDSKFQIPSL